MGKRTFSIVLALALLAGVFSALPARAQDPAPVAIPEIVQIDDPIGDANGVNDQDNAYGTPLAGEGDHVGPAGGTATDIRKVWFTNTATEVSLNIQLNGNPGNLAYDTYFRFSSNAGEGPVANDTTRGCLQWVASVNGLAGAYDAPTEGNLTDKCNVGEPVLGPLVIAPGPEGFVLTITFPRSYSPLLADGSSLTAPFGVSRILYVGPSPTTAAFATLDNTKRGTDYVITGGGPVVAPAPEEPKEEPPGKSDPPGKGKKKGCKKGKGKKKGACPDKPRPPVTPACPAYVPGDEGAEAETTIVTDAATEEKPVVVELTAGVGLANDLGLAGGAYDETSSVFQNVQVDTANADAGLYATLNFPAFHDYDLYLNYPDGSTAANSGDFNVAPGEGLGGGSPDGAWAAGNDFESVMGIRTADCGGYTARMVSYLTNGGPMTLSLWLGDVVADPAAPSGGGEEALSTFWSLMTPREATSSSGARVAAKKKKPRKPAACGTFTPGERGTDKPLLKVTDAATEEAPVEQTVTLAGSVADADLVGELPDEGPLAASSDFFNIQVDSANPDAGLYLLWEFPDRRDYDLEVLHTDGSYAARSHDFNPICGSPVSCSNGGHAGEAGTNFEKIVGIRTLDCAGWTVEAVNWLGEGGELTVTAWLGDVANEPQALGAEPHV